MPGHYGTNTRGNRGAERNQFDSFQFFPAPRNGGRREMRVDTDISVAGEMFCARQAAIFFNAADELRNVLGDALRIFAERTNIDDGIVGVVVDVRVGSENPAHAGCARLKSGYFADGVSSFRIVGCGDGHRRGKRSAFVDAHSCAGFKIRTDEQRSLRMFLQFVGERGSWINLAAFDTQRAALSAEDESP